MRVFYGLTLMLIAFSTTGRALPDATALQQSFDRLDQNHNGSISLVEWDQHAFAFFKATDRNNDNEIDPTEITDDAETVNSPVRTRTGMDDSA